MRTVRGAAGAPARPGERWPAALGWTGSIVREGVAFTGIAAGAAAYP